MNGPQNFTQFVGQDKIKVELEAMLFMKDNSSIILRGTYGSGKTTLAKLYARSRGNYTYQDTPEILKNLNPQAKTHVIDEIHLSGNFEILYDQIGQHTFVFCTTEGSKLPDPFISRCVQMFFTDYTIEELTKIVIERAIREEIYIDETSAKMIAHRCRGVPRTAIQLLKRVNNLVGLSNQVLTPRLTAQLLDFLEVYEGGVTKEDILYLNTLKSAENPVSLFALSSILNRDKMYIQDAIESFLINKHFISITPRGRILTDLGRKFLADFLLKS